MNLKIDNTLKVFLAIFFVVIYCVGVYGIATFLVFISKLIK